MHILYIIQYCDYDHFTFSGNSIIHKSTRTLQMLCWMAWISQVQSIQLPSIFLKARPWGVAITMKCRAMCLQGLEEWLSPWSTGLCVYMALRCGYHHEVQGYVFTWPWGVAITMKCRATCLHFTPFTIFSSLAPFVLISSLPRQSPVTQYTCTQLTTEIEVQCGLWYLEAT